MATDRQYEILTSIVSEYVKHGQPISSQQILEAYKLDMSSATIRNEMVILEQQGYIEKAYKSAGRIPTNKGYQYYLKNVQENPESIEFLKNKLKEIFSNRNENIESTISKALGVINDATNTLSISKSETKDTKLEDLKVYQISEDKLMILLVASNGEIHNSELMLNELKFEEIETAINIFSERLKGTYLYEIEEKANALKNIVSSNVKSLEDNFQEVIKLIFKNVTASTEQHQGVNSLVRANSVTSKQLEKVLELVENKTIWSVLKDNEKIEKGNTSVSLGIKELEDISIVNKNIEYGDNKRTLTIVGSKQQDYGMLFALLNFIETELKGK